MMSGGEGAQHEGSANGKSGRPATLAQAAIGHDNNLNLLRVFAALLVLASHSVAVSTGRSELEPGRHQLGLSLGDIAVDVFFVVSGFLVTGSLARSNSLRKYAAARGLRILPGLWVALIVTVLVVCIGFSSFPAIQNLLDWRTWRYLVRNAVIITGAEFWLPGAFAGNPFPASVNVSLWTLPLEVWMYILLAIEWLTTRRLFRQTSDRTFTWVLFGTATSLTAAALLLAEFGHPSNSTRHAAVFFVAAWMYQARARIPLRAGAAALAVVTVLGGAIWSQGAFDLAYRLLLPYIVLWVAYVPAGVIRLYNRVGDFSYGIYIYAFPFQQMTAAMFPGIGVEHLFLISGAMTTLAAILSWYLVESPALKLRSRIVHRP